MRLRLFGMLLLPVLFALPALAEDDTAQPRQERSALSLVEVGRSPAGKTLYSLEAYSVDLNTLVTEVLRRTGEEFSVAQDVAGTVSLVMRRATADDILDAVSRVARPPLRVARGRGIVVAQAEAGGPTSRIGRFERISPGQRGPLSPNSPSIADAIGVLQAPVTLEIADGKPVTMAEAMRSIEKQTGVAIHLDPRIPANLGFAARVTRTPLVVVLESIARTGALKWTAQPDGSILLAPTDWMRLKLGGAALPAASSMPCSRCGQPLAPDWRYCPGCGQAVVRKPAAATGTRSPAP